MALPVEVNPLLASGTAAGGGPPYTISRSLRFNSPDSPFLSRTLTSTGDRTRFTFSAWVKRQPGTITPLIAASPDGTTNNRLFLLFDTTDTLSVANTAGGTQTNWRTSTAVFRDPAAWYHVVINVDTTNATANNRVNAWVNGVQITAWSTLTNPTQNFATNFNLSGNVVRIGNPFSTNYADGYMTDIQFIDGQALSASQFGEVDATTGSWKPKSYTGTYGTNGFHLDFADNSAATATTLGKDVSGNTNNYTPNNFSVAAGANNDSLIDVPTAYDDGGNGRGNYCTWNPVYTAAVTSSLLNGMLVSNNNAASAEMLGTIEAQSGKWYFEATNAGSNNGNTWAIGIRNVLTGVNYEYLVNAATILLVGIRYDLDAGTIDYTLNGSTWVNIASSLPSGAYVPMTRRTTFNVQIIANFGQRPFTYTRPTGYLTLNTFNLPAPPITKSTTAFDTLLYTGNATSRNISGLSFQPDLVWIKKRNSTSSGDHGLYDSVRGATRFLNITTADEGVDTQALTGFNSDGFGLGNNAFVNSNTNTFAAFNWKKGVTPGFDIVTYTGTGAVRTVPHGLGVAPKMMFIKPRTTVGTDFGWTVYHASLAAPSTSYLQLNSSAVQVTGATNAFNSTSPTATEFTVSTSGRVNLSGDTYLAYLWSEVPGFSRFGAYTGNALADGPLVWCGFRPAFILIKIATGVSGNWVLINTKTGTTNVVGPSLTPNSTAVEATATLLDVLSNGFKIRTNSALVNNTGSQFVFAAFAEYPFKYALAR